MELKCLFGAIIGGTIVYFIMHGACNLKNWLMKLKRNIDKKIKEKTCLKN